MNNWVLISDLDGIFTTPNFTYTVDGKTSKSFSANDAHVAKLLIPHLKEFKILTGESTKEGLAISKKRMEDVELDQYLNMVKSNEKMKWIKERYDISKVAYFGDDIFDIAIFKECCFCACPSSALPILKNYVNYVSNQKGGEDAFADMALYFYTNVLNLDIEPFINNI